MKVTGGCFCRAVRYEALGPPRRVSHCHCLHCRGTSGAPFLTWAEFDAAAFRFTSGAPGSFESRPGVTRRFCGRCGTQITYENAATKTSIDVTLGSLDDPNALPPSDHIWCTRMLTWLRLEDGLPRHDKERIP